MTNCNSPQSHKRSVMRFVFLSALAMVIAGCGGAALAQSAKPANADTKLTVVNFGFTAAFGGDWPLVVADKRNFFRDRGIDFRVTRAQNPADNIRALIVGTLQFVVSVPDSIILPNQGGADLIAVASVMNHTVYRLLAAKGVTAVKDLKGMRIAVSRLNGPDAIMFDEMAEQAGIRKGEYDYFVTGGGTNQRMAALLSGGASATMLAPPADGQAINAGMTDLGLTLGKTKPQQFSGLITNRKWAQTNTETVVQTVRALQDALKWLKDPANKGAAIKILSEYINVSPELAASAYRDYVGDQFVFSTRGEFNMEGIGNVVDNLLNAGTLKKPPPINLYFPTNFVDQASR